MLKKTDYRGGNAPRETIRSLAVELTEGPGQDDDKTHVIKGTIKVGNSLVEAGSEIEVRIPDTKGAGAPSAGGKLRGRKGDTVTVTGYKQDGTARRSTLGGKADGTMAVRELTAAEPVITYKDSEGKYKRVSANYRPRKEDEEKAQRFQKTAAVIAGLDPAKTAADGGLNISLRQYFPGHAGKVENTDGLMEQIREVVGSGYDATIRAYQDGESFTTTVFANTTEERLNDIAAGKADLFRDNKIDALAEGLENGTIEADIMPSKEHYLGAATKQNAFEAYNSYQTGERRLPPFPAWIGKRAAEVIVSVIDVTGEPVTDNSAILIASEGVTVEETGWRVVAAMPSKAMPEPPVKAYDPAGQQQDAKDEEDEAPTPPPGP